MKAFLETGINKSFANSEMEIAFQSYAWKNFRRLYSIAGMIMFFFTVYLGMILSYINGGMLINPILISAIMVSFIVQAVLASFWLKDKQPFYLNPLITLMAISMSTIYVVFLEEMPDQFHETLISLSFLNALGMIFLSNGRIYLITLNVMILIIPINAITIIYHQHYSLWFTGPGFLGLSVFLTYLDIYSRRVSRLNWSRRQSMDTLYKEISQIADDALEDKSRIEEAAQKNIALMEEVYYSKEEAERHNQFLSNLIEGIPLGITVMNDKTEILQMNRQAVELLGITFEKDEPKTFKNLKAFIDVFREKEGHHSPRFWASYDKIIPRKMNPEVGKAPPFIKSDFKMENGTFISFTEEQLGSGEHILITQDITYRKEIEANMRELALTDSLTGLANRHAFNMKFDDAIARNIRNKTSLGLAIIDLDKFKPINDTHGHPVGDKILQYVGDTLKEQIRSVDMPCRLGGDEFAVLFTDIMPERPPTIACQRILEALNKTVEIDGLSLKLGASIGLTFSNSPDIEPEQMIIEADRALYRAKEEGRGILEVIQTDL